MKLFGKKQKVFVRHGHVDGPVIQLRKGALVHGYVSTGINHGVSYDVEEFVEEGSAMAGGRDKRKTYRCHLKTY
jgi:hypothetical protein